MESVKQCLETNDVSSQQQRENQSLKSDDMSIDPDSSSVSDAEKGSPKAGSELTAASALTSLVNSQSNPNNVEEDEEEEDRFHIPQRFTKSGRKRAVPFPLKLMKVLCTKEHEEIITWMPSGKSFSILKPKAFVADILPTHFKSAKYSSFTRKLHRWGFMRHYRGEEAGAFYHKLFQKDRLDLVEQMTCHKMEPSKPVAQKPSPTHEIHLSRPQIAPRSTVAAFSPHKDGHQAAVPAPVAEASGPRRPIDAAERLNAAIELEVNRRLKERITAAQISRQAMGIMQLQQQASAPFQDLRALPWNGSGLNPAMALLLGKGPSPGLDPACFAYAMSRGDTQPLENLPRTNIQGAKTA